MKLEKDVATNKKKRILMVTAVEAEMETVLQGLRNQSNIDVLLGGVGPIAAAISTTKALLNKDYDLVVSAGIGGGFSGRVAIGQIVVASQIISADLGVETLEGFSSLEQLGFGRTSVSVDAKLVQGMTTALQKAQLPVITGPVITVSTATGRAESTLKLVEQVPAVCCEAMEGFGVAMAAQEMGVPVIEVRAISNLVGPRDKGAWRIKEALDALKQASSVIGEVLS